MLGRMTQESVLALAREGQEKIIAKHNFPTQALEQLSVFKTASERQFVFRCFWLPYQLIQAREREFRSPIGRFWHMYEFAFLLAHSRMLNEMRAWGQDPRLSWWCPVKAAEASKWWMARFDSYRIAIDSSFDTWLGRRCANSDGLEPSLVAAARFGYLEKVNIDGLPSASLFHLRRDWKELEGLGGRESEFFHRHATPGGVPEPRWDYPDIDLWLKEIWPIVTQYDWRYAEVYQLALEKFGDEDRYIEAGALDRPAVLKDHCQLLGLRLSPLAQRRRGRPRNQSDSNVSEYFGNSVYRQLTKRSPSSDEDTQVRGSTAFQRLAALAINVEPFTRLISGTSREPIDFACPKLKIGGEHGKVTPPFFESPMPHNARHAYDKE